MALQVWLPLTGSFENLGLYDLSSPSRNTFSEKAEGKVGPSCEGAGNLQYHLAADDLLEEDRWTAAAWILYSGSATTTGIQYIITKNASGGFSDMQMSLHLSSSQRICSCIDGTEYKSPALTQSFVENTWYHIASTYDGSKYRFYLNGECVGSGSITKTRLANKTNLNIGTRSSNAAGTGGSGGILSGSRWYNDIRLYDEALSAREIKEISKGLVAHIPYNDTPLTSNKLYDTSGYHHHGVCTNASRPVIATDSPRRTRCVKFDTTSKYVQITNLPALGDNYTFAWWGWWPNNNTNVMFWGYTDGNRYNMYKSSNKLYNNTGDGTQNPFYTTGTTVAPAVGLGAWRHYAITGDGTSNKLYVNGSLYATAKTFKAVTGTTITMPGWDTSTSYKNAGTEISDLRVYSTALSAEDIMELAKNPISVCKNGTLMCQEVVE